MEELCRLCLKKSSEICIFPQNEESLAMRIMACCSLEIQNSNLDQMPKKICKDCRFQLEKSYYFRKVSQLADSKLKKYIRLKARSKNKEESINIENELNLSQDLEDAEFEDLQLFITNIEKEHLEMQHNDFKKSMEEECKLWQNQMKQQLEVECISKAKAELRQEIETELRAKLKEECLQQAKEAVRVDIQQQIEKEQKQLLLQELENFLQQKQQQQKQAKINISSNLIVNPLKRVASTNQISNNKKIAKVSNALDSSAPKSSETNAINAAQLNAEENILPNDLIISSSHQIENSSEDLQVNIKPSQESFMFNSTEDCNDFDSIPDNEENIFEPVDHIKIQLNACSLSSQNVKLESTAYESMLTM